MGIGRSCDLQTGGSQASWSAGRCDSRGGGGCTGLSGTVVDNPPCTHTRVRMTWLGWKEVNHPSMGSVWHAQIGASLVMRVLGAQELYKGPHGLQQGMAVNECAVQCVGQMLVKYTLS